MTRRSRFARTANALRSLDSAPPAPLTDAEMHHAATERARIMATPVPDTTPARTAWPYRRLALAAGILVAVAALVPYGLGGTPAFASWTPIPTLLTGAAAEEAGADCLRRHTDHEIPANLEADWDTSAVPEMKPVLAEQRGDWVTVFLAGGGAEASCLMQTDIEPDEHQMMGGYNPDAAEPPAPEQDGLVETHAMSGSFDVPNRIGIGTIDDWYGWVAGYVGDEVSAVTVHSPAGTDVEASVNNGQYSAWWPAGPARGSNPAVGGGWSYTVTLTDGTTQEIKTPR
ncbi:hypothetical protein [Tessaracoccus caeni]|uniref:hypothetical protein n=1 Tax=Tessaracoccus caeni TaxID=3031239 RepID=UPI0023DBA15B|nr:hypothetical protein [Tessaracoccus caeni]MDF1486882.1 hypothetical protein [Tessaracoccus caeni]